MRGTRLHAQAVAYATGAGCVAFILALLAMQGGVQGGTQDGERLPAALVLAIVCGALGWASAQRSLAGVAQAVDLATRRLLEAAHGDLDAPVAREVRGQLPDLAVAVEGLLSQVRGNLESVQRLALYDPVTGLANRASFCRQVERMLAECEASGPCAMFFIDLDGFKDVNDTLGHAAGDQILARVAGRLREVVTVQAGARQGDAVLGRLAGDEFTLFFANMPPETSAMRVARAIQYALSESFDVAGVQIEVGASIGVAYYPEHGSSLASLLRSADHAMYEAKNRGRRRVELYTSDLEQRIAGRSALERDLRRAIERDEFLLEFQPQVDFAAGRIVAAEALVRWAHPDRSLVMPDAFLALAEESGLIVELGDWIVNRVCETAARWSAAGLDHRLAINLSARELVQPDFFLRFEAAMARHNVAPRMLELELGESLVMRLEGELVSQLATLRARGMRIAIDDFGTGFSNLARLKDLPVDRVKIDRSLVRDIVSSAEARTICSAIVSLVQGLGLEAVIEGVESEEQIALLRVLGCHVFQGFHLSRPIREESFIARFGPDMPPPARSVEV